MNPISVNLMVLIAIVAVYYVFLRKKPQKEMKTEMAKPKAKAAA